MASFRNFFKFLVQADRIDGDTETKVCEDLKMNKDAFLDAVDFDY